MSMSSKFVLLKRGAIATVTYLVKEGRTVGPTNKGQVLPAFLQLQHCAECGVQQSHVEPQRVTPGNPLH